MHRTRKDEEVYPKVMRVPLGAKQDGKNENIAYTMEKRLTLGDFGSTERLFDDNVPAYSRHVSNQDATTGATKSEQTFRPKRNTDSVCKHVNAFEDARAALVGELDFLVGTAGQNRASGLSGSATESTRRRRRDVMHGVGM
jgi:hypothetical protein